MQNLSIIGKNKKRKGFSLVELVVVIGILAVLAVTAVISFGNLNAQAEAAAVNSDANAVVRALNTYNALAKTPKGGTGIVAPPVITAIELKALITDLKLDATTKSDLVTMDLSLSVDTSGAKWTKVAAKVGYKDGNFYVIN